MNNELQNQLFAKYPSIFREVGGEPSQTCMAFGIECGNGWHDLIDLLCDSITHQVESTNRLYPDLKFAVVAAQIKEKYGGLRFYVDYVYDHELIKDAAAMKEHSDGKAGKGQATGIFGWEKPPTEDAGAEKAV